MSYFASITQNVKASTLNSSTTPIPASSSWEGSSESTLGVAGIQINISTNQNCTVTIYQSMDGSNWDIYDSYEYLHTLGGNSWTVQATASYFKIKVTNSSATVAADPFRFQTALCPIVEALPRSLEEHGWLKTCIKEIHGPFGEEVKAMVTSVGELRTAQAFSLAGAAFIGDVVDSNFWNILTSGTASALQGNGILTMATGSTANSSVIVKSLRIARYAGGSTNQFRGVATMPAVTTSVGTNTRRYGAFDENDGYFFEFNQANGASSPVLRLVCRKSTSDSNYVESGSFNGDHGTIWTPDTNAHLLEIYWDDMYAYFMVDGDVIHKFTGTTLPLVGTQSLKIGMQCVNAGGNTANNNFRTRSAVIQRIGSPVTQPTWYNISANASGVPLKTGAGNLHSVTINKPGDSLNALTLYDGTSIIGSQIGSIVTDVSNNTTTPSTLDFKGVPFASGLYCSLATGTAGNYTIIYE